MDFLKAASPNQIWFYIIMHDWSHQNMDEDAHLDGHPTASNIVVINNIHIWMCILFMILVPDLPSV